MVLADRLARAAQQEAVEAVLEASRAAQQEAVEAVLEVVAPVVELAGAAAPGPRGGGGWLPPRGLGGLG